MKLQGDITVNGRMYPEGTDVPWYQIYPFFLFHMLAFGWSGFYMAYGAKNFPVPLLYLHGGVAVVSYSKYYLIIFGRDEVKWMFINGFLGLFGIYSQIGWILSLFGKRISDYPAYVHLIPFLYYVLYTFLIRHAVVDITRSREFPERRKIVETFYIAVSVLVYLVGIFFVKR